MVDIAGFAEKGGFVKEMMTLNAWKLESCSHGLFFFFFQRIMIRERDDRKEKMNAERNLWWNFPNIYF